MRHRRQVVVDSDTGEVTYQNKSSCDHVKGENTCNYLWKKDGKELENGTKYSFNSRLTYDFCENFEKTGDFVRRFKVFTVSDHDQEWDLSCFTSGLVINNVTEDDFGIYQCSYINSSGDSYSVHLKNITVFKAGSSVDTMPKKVEYFEHSHPKGTRSILLMQCMATGGPIHWFISFKEEQTCDSKKTASKCENSTLSSIDNVSGIDAWRCFNFSTESHMPYNSGGHIVSESFLLFERVCSVDWANIFCCLDYKGNNCTEAQHVTAKNVTAYWEFIGKQGRTNLWSIPLFILIAVIIIVSIACCRARVCGCCRTCLQQKGISISHGEVRVVTSEDNRNRQYRTVGQTPYKESRDSRIFKRLSANIMEFRNILPSAPPYIENDHQYVSIMQASCFKHDLTISLNCLSLFQPICKKHSISMKFDELM
jgi:hypothetical protein